MSPVIITSIPETFSAISRFFSYPACDKKIILLSPLAWSSATIFLAVSTSSWNFMSFPGLEDSTVFPTTSNPTMATSCPSIFLIT